MHCRRPRLWRPKALPSAERGTAVRLPDPLPRQHHGDRRRWRSAHRCGLGRTGRPCPPPTWRAGDRRTLSGRHRAVRAGSGAAWCLATSSSDANARALMSLYGKRWSIECGLRDTKDLRFGMGMGSIHVSTPARRDRLWLLNALAIALLTLLGAAGEALGYDRYLKSNTTKRRTHSL